MAQCTICGREFEETDVVKLGDYSVCADCKPVFVQRLREGLPVSAERVYGGFWIRVGAQLIDGVILWGVNALIGVLAAFTGSRGASVFASLLSFVIGIAYVTYFLGSRGATPGKMACGLKVIRSDGTEISYLRAFARFWAQYLSAMILCIGYLMVAFDKEKRALHDHICDTRVVKG
jgi:uncharacterized RDD family membrane protein YckC